MTMHEFLHQVSAKNADQPEFIQAVTEVVESIWDVYDANPQYRKGKILDRLVEPERIIMFRVPWQTDAGEVIVNRGYRIEFNDWWFNIRPSNTEPYLRFIAEARSEELLAGKIAKAEEILHKFN